MWLAFFLLNSFSLSTCAKPPWAFGIFSVQGLDVATQPQIKLWVGLGGKSQFRTAMNYSALSLKPAGWKALFAAKLSSPHTQHSQPLAMGRALPWKTTGFCLNIFQKINNKSSALSTLSAREKIVSLSFLHFFFPFPPNPINLNLLK